MMRLLLFFVLKRERVIAVFENVLTKDHIVLITGIPKQPDTLQLSSDKQGTCSPLELPPTRLSMSTMPKQSVSEPAESNDSEPKAKCTTYNAEEKSEQTSMETDEPSTLPPALKSNDLPSTSKEIANRQSGSGFNLYMQLKKKTYFDLHESDKRNDGPQDLSCSKPNPEVKNAKLDDSDVEMTDIEGSSFDVSHQVHSGESSASNASVRPQIIVSPRNATTFKSSSTDDSATITVANESSSSSQLSGTSSENIAKGSSPSKGVIVCIGSSTMVNYHSIYFCYSRMNIGDIIKGF